MKKLAFLFSLIMILVLVTSCSNDTQSDTASTDTTDKASTTDETITIWCWDGNFNVRAANIAADMYEQENPGVKVEVQELAQNDIVAKLNTSLGSGNLKGLPNIVLIEDYKINGYLSSYPDSFINLSPSLDVSNFMPFKLNSMTYEDNVYGVPFDSGVTTMYYRSDLLHEAGYDDSIMQDLTWSQYIDLGVDIKEKTGVSLIDVDQSDLGIIRVMLQSGSKWYVKEDGVTPDILDNDALVDALNTYKSFQDSGVGYYINDWAGRVSAVNSGKVFSTVTGNWYTPSITQEESQNGLWRVAPIPKLDNAPSVAASNLGGSSWYVLNVDNSELATDFLVSTFGTDEELMSVLVDEIGLVSTMKSFAENTEKYSQPQPYFGDQKIFEDFITWSNDVPGVNYGANTYNIEDILKSLMPDFLKTGDMDKLLTNFDSQVRTQIR